MRVEDDEQDGQLGEQARRREALARVEKLRESVQARNQDLTDEEAEALAERFTGEAIAEMARKGNRL